jgi:anti-sigma factor RsiW
MTEERIRELLSEMRHEPLPPESLARVRLAVARRIEQEGRMPLSRARWRLAVVALAMAAVLIAVAVHPLKHPIGQSTGPAPGPKPAATAAVAAPPSDVRAPRFSPAPRPRAESVRHAGEPRPPEEAPLIRIETSDPDVVILLVAEGSGS